MTQIESEAPPTTGVQIKFKFKLNDLNSAPRRRSISDCFDSLADIERFMTAVFWRFESGLLTALDSEFDPNSSMDAVIRRQFLMNTDISAAERIPSLQIEKLSYQSPFELAAYITVGTGAVSRIAYAFFEVRNRFWDSNLHKAKRQFQMSFLKPEDFNTLSQAADEEVDRAVQVIEHHNETLEGVRRLAREIEAADVEVDGQELTDGEEDTPTSDV